jgi:hypothetical protein
MPTRDLSGTTFDPAATALMHAAFEAAWKSLEEGGCVEAAPYSAERMRETLALRIIETADRGERDLIRLRNDALKHLASGEGASPDTRDAKLGNRLPHFRGGSSAQGENGAHGEA